MGSGADGPGVEQGEGMLGLGGRAQLRHGAIEDRRGAVEQHAQSGQDDQGRAEGQGQDKKDGRRCAAFGD